MAAAGSRLARRVAGDHGRLVGLRVRPAGADRGLVRALAGLVAGQGFGRVDVAERRVLGCYLVPARRAHAEPLAEDREERLRLHLPDARQGEQAALEVAR